MAPKVTQNLKRLEKLCLERVLADTDLHAVKNGKVQGQDQSVNYRMFQMLYSEKLVKRFERTCIDRYSTDWPAYLDFIFNPFLRRIEIEHNTNFDEEIAATMAKNCKNLSHIKIREQFLTSSRLSASPYFVNFLRRMTNLVYLDLSACSLDCVPTMKAISDFLIHLRTLRLSKTKVDDCAIFALCGHEQPTDGSVLKCSFVKTCETNSRIQLQVIDISHTRVTEFGYACLLMHIPTLKCISAKELPTAIDLINRYRTEKLGISGIQFNLEALHYLGQTRYLKKSLDACPRLKELYFEDRIYDDHLGKILAESELLNLKCVIMDPEEMSEICTGHFKSFWKKRGPLLNSLQLSSFHWGSTEVELRRLSYILSNCPNLRHFGLELRNAPFHNRAYGIEEALLDFPKLPYLKNLRLCLGGQIDVNTFASKIILSAPNVSEMTLFFKFRPEFLSLCMTKQHLPKLNKVTVSIFRYPPIKEIKMLVGADKCKLDPSPGFLSFSGGSMFL